MKCLRLIQITLFMILIIEKNKTSSPNSYKDCNDSLSITWIEVVLGRNVGTQVWHKKTQKRDMHNSFKIRKKGIPFILNSLCHEMFGGRIQMFRLLACYYRANKMHSKSTINKMTSDIQNTNLQCCMDRNSNHCWIK